MTEDVPFSREERRIVEVPGKFGPPWAGREAELMLLPCKLPEDTWVSLALASESASSETR